MDPNTSSLPINVLDLLSFQGVEKQRIEFKAAWHDDKTHKRGTYWQVVHTICAFANDYYNDNGGYIIFGVEQKENWETADDSDRQIIFPPCGVPAQRMERIQKEIVGACRLNIRPEFTPILSPEVVEGRLVLVVWVTASDDRPHKCREDSKGEFQYYIRKATQTVKATHNEIRQLMEQHSKIPFDDRMARDTANGKQLSEDDIDATLVKEFLKDVNSSLSKDQELRQLYQNLALVRKEGDKREGDRLLPILIPRVVALLFFNRNPHIYFGGAKTEIATYNFDNEPIGEEVLKGPIDHQIKDTLSYILDKTKEEVSYAFVTYPERALREAVVNAFYHRGYEPKYNGPVKVHIYPNYIDVISYPGPHPSLKLEHFKDGKEVPPVQARNRRIGELLKERKLAEGRGSGIRTIFRSMKANQSPSPSFEFDEGNTYFRVRLPGHPKYIVRELCNDINRLFLKGDKEDAVKLLTSFLDDNPSMKSDFLIGKLLELCGNDKHHENVRPYQEYISERLEKRTSLVTELDKWIQSPGVVDVTEGARIVRCLVEGGATCDHLQSVIKMAVGYCLELGPDKKPILEKVQNAHKLFDAMGELTLIDPFVAYQFGCCKFSLYILNQRGSKKGKHKELIPYLNEAEDLVLKASQLTSKEKPHHLANQCRELGYIYYQLIFLDKSTETKVVDCYKEARKLNPNIKINQFYVPRDYRSTFRNPVSTSQQ